MDYINRFPGNLIFTYFVVVFSIVSGLLSSDAFIANHSKSRTCDRDKIPDLDATTSAVGYAILWPILLAWKTLTFGKLLYLIHVYYPFMIWLEEEDSPSLPKDDSTQNSVKSDRNN